MQMQACWSACLIVYNALLVSLKYLKLVIVASDFPSLSQSNGGHDGVKRNRASRVHKVLLFKNKCW